MAISDRFLCTPSNQSLLQAANPAVPTPAPFDDSLEPETRKDCPNETMNSTPASHSNESVENMPVSKEKPVMKVTQTEAPTETTTKLAISNNVKAPAVPSNQSSTLAAASNEPGKIMPDLSIVKAHGGLANQNSHNGAAVQNHDPHAEHAGRKNDADETSLQAAHLNQNLNAGIAHEAVNLNTSAEVEYENDLLPEFNPLPATFLNKPHGGARSKCKAASMPESSVSLLPILLNAHDPDKNDDISCRAHE